ncbi:CBF/Mak21 family protein (macronuclear) [Tetrahymena thermophila SB210]|uniref:CBF/Mak21 family protein n=1 Tax=Tetrahymena thermophila (strain SB210) TaxID=312017 RepID=Q23PZ9_TETTS|nr:CBF/Mak21 family protein [Tetrahymena thermophila SB210]EAR98536.1 CBF/Mak21 family protein [Tetrahymena thermophila SB210]|eukprot:XP_001018781.1 CBF/Mak21 family protein [Tetrahymena thermophila SB210]
MSTDMKQICQDIITQKNDLNKINDLLKFALSNDQGDQEEAIKYLRKVFKLFIKGKKLIEFKDLTSFEIQVNNTQYEVFQEFLKKKFIAYVEILKSNIFSTRIGENIKELSLRVLFELSRYHFESIRNSQNMDYSDQTMLYDIMFSIISEIDKFDDILFVLIEYIQNYPDFSIAILKILSKITKKTSSTDIDMQQNIITFTQYIPSLENLEFNSLFLQLEAQKKKVDLIKRKAAYDIDRDGKQIEKPEIDQELYLRKWKDSFSEFIFSIIQKLKQSNNQQLLLNFISGFSKYIFHKMEDPLLLANFLVDVFDSTKDFNMQIISLSQLFILIGKHQLEYPKYYHKLFSLFDQNEKANQRNQTIFLTSHTPKFLKLVETSLKTTKLSHKILSSFIKKILRVAMVHPPNILLWAVSLTINIIKKNPTLVAMLDTQELKEKIQDCFIPDQKDLDNCQAQESFLWELKSIKNHYLNEVEKMVKVLGTKLDVAQFIELESFTDVQYDHFIRLYIDAAKNKKVTFPIENKIENIQQLQLINTTLFE